MSLEEHSLKDLRSILEAVAAGRVGVEEGMRLLPLLEVAALGEFARLDVGRHLRKGVPEVVYAPRKTDSALAAIVRELLVQNGMALVSRLTPERFGALEPVFLRPVVPASFRGAEGETRAAEAGPSAASPVVSYSPEAGTLEITLPGYRLPGHAGLVGILTAGTSDIAVAEEAALVARHMGCEVERAFDVGVAGVHRLLEPLARMMRAGADALVVVAGMEGALPSVVAGLVDVPVIGVPTSTGYGLGGDGTAALLSILQSCSPGLLAVNIDNGVGAGAAAALMARRCVRAGNGSG
jgi:pyridinium-3,5-biscarboxylic acid mononucleotide synthase